MQLSATRALPLFVPTMVHAYNLIKSIVLYFQDIRTHLAEDHSIYQDIYSMSIREALLKKNTKNWYTIDALGAIFAIFTILDTFTILLQY